MDKYLECFDLLSKYVLLMKVNSDNEISYVSSAWNKYFDNKLEHFLGKSAYDVLELDNTKELNEIIKLSPDGQFWTKEVKYTTGFGKELYFDTKVVPTEDGKSFVIHQEDITDRKVLERLSITDELTSLYNRRYFNMSFYKLAIKAENDKNMKLALLIIDIDCFKQYNDTYGHPAGDRALRKFGHNIKDTLEGKTDYVFRLGGEEFGVLLIDYDVEEVLSISEEIRKNVEDMHIVHEKNTASKYITVSTGIVVVDFSSEDKDTNTIYSMADDSLYKAKEQGRNCTVCYNCENSLS